MEMLRIVIWDVEEWAELGWSGWAVERRERSSRGGQQDLLLRYYTAQHW